MEYTEDGKINILGKNYIEKPRSRSKSKSYSELSPLMMMAAAFQLLYPIYGDKKEKVRPKVNILTEFELIQQKKSKLSKSNRDWVEYMFHKNFIEVK